MNHDTHIHTTRTLLFAGYVRASLEPSRVGSLAQSSRSLRCELETFGGGSRVQTRLQGGSSQYNHKT